MTVLGFDLIQGPEVPAPHPAEASDEPMDTLRVRSLWQRRLENAVSVVNAVGVVSVRSNGETVMFGLSEDDLFQATRDAVTCHLLLVTRAT